MSKNTSFDQMRTNAHPLFKLAIRDEASEGIKTLYSQRNSILYGR